MDNHSGEVAGVKGGGCVSWLWVLHGSSKNLWEGLFRKEFLRPWRLKKTKF